MKKLNYEPISHDMRHRLGLIVLQSDITIEDEFRYYLDGLPTSLLVNRIPFENEVTVETLKAMQSHVGNTMNLFPIDAEFDVMGYGCTSGALHIGDDTLAKLVGGARPTRNVTNPMQAAIAAFNALGARKIAYLSPYSEFVSQSMINEIQGRGVSVDISATFDEPLDKKVGRISPESIKHACIELAAESEIDAIFVSCTNMKCAHIIPEIETQTGIVTISSNQALAWHMFKLGGCGMPENKGRLFQCT